MSDVTQDELKELLDDAWNHAVVKAWAEGGTEQDALEGLLSEVTGCMCPSCRQKFEEAMRERREAPIRQTIKGISARLDIIERDLKARKNSRHPTGGDRHECKNI